MEHKVLYQKRPAVTIEEMMQAFQSKRAEVRAKVLRMELDYELAVLHDALERQDERQVEASKQKLAGMRQEMLLLEL
jgi:hypothetical protein